jgi:folate-binding protein YgfZ
MLRPSRALFRLSGPDATRLLFDVLTARIVAEPGPARWWALLSPQGKIQAEGLWSFADDAYWLDCDNSVAADFQRRMRLYRLRAKVEISPLTETHAVGWTLEGAGVEDGRTPGLGRRVIATRAEAAGWIAETKAPALARIEAGIAELGPDFSADAVFPHDIGMDLLAGVDFQKGCYIGQEVVSRMQHRGTARRRPVIVSGLEDADSGAPVLAGSREAGALGTVAGGKAVAILRLDRIADPDAASVNRKPVRLALPAWASYGFGESAGAE